jgi:hypothetical protein
MFTLLLYQPGFMSVRPNGDGDYISGYTKQIHKGYNLGYYGLTCILFISPAIGLYVIVRHNASDVKFAPKKR